MTRKTMDSVLYSPTVSMANADVQAMPMPSMANVARMMMIDRTPTISTRARSRMASSPVISSPPTAASISSWVSATSPVMPTDTWGGGSTSARISRNFAHDFRVGGRLRIARLLLSNINR